MDSTPTTPEQLTAALVATTAAQDPWPWDPNYFWPRQLGAGPRMVMMEINEGLDTVVITYDDVLDPGSPSPDNFSLNTRGEDPGDVVPFTINDAANVDDYHIELEVTAGAEVPGVAALIYTGAGTLPVVGGNGQEATPQELPL